MQRIKAVVIDEDILIRRAITEVLENECKAVDVVSGNLDETEKLIKERNPDVVFLDIEHAESNGFLMFNTLRVRYPRLNIVVLSSWSDRGARAVLYAVKNGAVEFITKPEHNRVMLLHGNHFEKRLPPIVRGIRELINRNSLVAFTEQMRRYQWDVSDLGKNDSEHFINNKIRLVVIGGNMGSLKSLLSLFRQLPADFPVPVVVVQHIPGKYSSALAVELNRVSGLTVREAFAGAELIKGEAWVARGGHHCEVQQLGNTSNLKVHRGPRVNSVRPSIDLLFQSSARLYGSGVLGIVLSGNGIDGLAGVRAVKEAGGTIIVQDPGSAMIDRLPQSVIKSGQADSYYPIEQIGNQIISYIGRGVRKKRGRNIHHMNQLQKSAPISINTT